MTKLIRFWLATLCVKYVAPSGITIRLELDKGYTKEIELDRGEWSSLPC